MSTPEPKLDEQSEIAALRHEMAELRAGIQALESKTGKTNGAPHDDLTRRMQIEMEKEDRPASVGVLRSTVFLNKKGGNSTLGTENIMGAVDKLPAVESVIALCASLNSPLAVRALYLLFQRVYAQEPVRQSKAELAAALSVGETELEDAFRPLVANEVIRWGKNFEGQDYYQIERLDLFAILLTFV